MTTIALIFDPDWRILFDRPEWNDPNLGSSPMAQWRWRTKAAFNQLPPADRLLTVLSRDDAYGIHWLWDDRSQSINQYSWPHESIQSVHPNLSYYSNIKNFKILSLKWENPATKTRPKTQVPMRVMMNTQYGLINARAPLDAIDRLFEQKKYKIDHLFICDPGQRIHGNTLWRIPPCLSVPAGLMYETCYANSRYQQMDPNTRPSMSIVW